MTVGFLLNTCEPFYRGGYERRVWSFARELARQGHDVRIYTSCPTNETIENVRFIRLGAPREFFNSRGVRNGVADFLFSLCVLRLLWKLKARELDVLDVCATPFLHLPVGAGVARIKQIPMVLTCHEALLSSLDEYARERGHRSRVAADAISSVLARIYRFGMGLSDRRIAVSKRTAAALRAEGFPAAATVEFGLEAEAFCLDAPTESSGPVRFVFCGRLTPIKNVDHSLAALLALRAEGEIFRLDIVGVGSELSRLRAMTKVAGADDCITFHGEISEQAKRDLLARSEVFILSSPREGFSIATLEAMAMGCCAVVVNDPLRPNGATDFVQHGAQGLWALPEPLALKEALHSLIEDPTLRLRLRRAAWQKAKIYRVESQARLLADYYTEAGTATTGL